MRKMFVAALISTLMIAGNVWAKDSAPVVEDEQLLIKPGDKIQDFELVDTNGEIVKSTDLRKNKVFVIRIIKTSENMAVDRMQTSILTGAKKKYGDKLAIVDIISKDENKAGEIADRMKGIGVTWPILIDTKGEFAESIGLPNPPALLGFDKEGISIKARRYFRPDDFEEMMD